MPTCMAASHANQSSTPGSASVLRIVYPDRHQRLLVNAELEVVWDDERRTLSVGFDEHDQPRRLVVGSRMIA